MPNQPNKSTEELINTNFTHDITLQSPLQNHKTLDDAYLSQVTDEELDAYDEEYSQKRQSYYNPSMSNLNKCEDLIRKAVRNIFGSTSKESKYIKRAFEGAGVILRNNWNSISEPRHVRKAVEDARELAKTHSAVSLDEKDVTQIDLAIKYLIQKGYTYGVDFTSNNAVNIAKSSLVSETTTDQKMQNAMRLHHSDCSDTCRDSAYEMRINESRIDRECSCGEIDVRHTIELGVNDSDEIQLTLGEYNKYNG
tara:strand:+ start:140 stop:895 length:756 start_codon:yes stop_codon:yes gene_type:complete